MKNFKDMDNKELLSTKEWAYSEVQWTKSDMRRCMDQPYIGDDDVDNMRKLIADYDRYQTMIVDINIEYYGRRNR